MRNEYHRDLPAAFDRLGICQRCAKVFGPIDSPTRINPTESQQQRCDCMEVPPQSRTTPSETVVLEALTLCRCCGRVALASGSLYSVWFCRACYSYIELINENVLECFIPICRYSIRDWIDRRERYAWALPAMPNVYEGDYFESAERLEDHGRKKVLNLMLQMRHSNQSECLLSEYLAWCDAQRRALDRDLLELGKQFYVPDDYLQLVLRRVHGK